MRKAAGTIVGKSVAAAVKLRGRSSGQAMPGLVVERMVPGYLSAMLKQLPGGVVIITGTNGKTTTTKMVVELLRAAGKKVLTNSTGSNLTRGIISSITEQAGLGGRLPFDLAVFELDEAYARRFSRTVTPRWVLGLNASRDQLDRFGEVDTVAQFVIETMLTATDGIVTNADDKRLATTLNEASAEITYFGVAADLLHLFPRDDELVSVTGKKTTLEAAKVPLAVELVAMRGSVATYKIDDATYDITLQVTGQHNYQNAAAALALVHKMVPKVAISQLVHSMAQVQPAFGRGEQFTLKNGSRLQLNLVKNPASFSQGLISYIRPEVNSMVAINDAVADSRDMSWLWDIDFARLKDCKATYATGTRAADMALRLSYDDIEVAGVEPNLPQALSDFCAQPGDKVLFASYTAMLQAYTLLSKQAGKSL